MLTSKSIFVIVFISYYFDTMIVLRSISDEKLLKAKNERFI
jgi:hypothetical protein